MASLRLDFTTLSPYSSRIRACSSMNSRLAFLPGPLTWLFSPSNRDFRMRIILLDNVFSKTGCPVLLRELFYGEVVVKFTTYSDSVLYGSDHVTRSYVLVLGNARLAGSFVPVLKR